MRKIFFSLLLLVYTISWAKPTPIIDDPEDLTARSWLVTDIDDKILEYYSQVGNNDVPYPIIIGEKNLYFMLNKCYVPKEHVNFFLTTELKADLCLYFYNNPEFKKYSKAFDNLNNINL